MEKPPSPEETAADVAKKFSGVTNDRTRRQAIRDWLIAAALSAVLLPVILGLYNFSIFGQFDIGEIGWAITVFFVILCLLWALGLFFLPRTDYHTKVKPKGGILDHIAAFWLIACALGPFLAWITTCGAIPITLTTWKYLFTIRVILTIALPVLTALPMLRYVRGKAALIQVPLLLALTLLPVLCGLHYAQDLRSGTALHKDPNSDNLVSYLPHTKITLQR